MLPDVPHKLEDHMTHAIVWDGIDLSISHTPNWLNSEFHHVELRADERLPVTETGYRSHFIHQGRICAFRKRHCLRRAMVGCSSKVTGLDQAQKGQPPAFAVLNFKPRARNCLTSDAPEMVRGRQA